MTAVAFFFFFLIDLIFLFCLAVEGYFLILFPKKYCTVFVLCKIILS